MTAKSAWPTSLNVPDLNMLGEVHVWCAHLANKSDSEIKYYWDVLDVLEQHRALRFVQKHHQTRFIISHGILRKLLARYLQADAPSITFQENLYGKPEVAKQKKSSHGLAIQFNISHSNDLALFAFTLEKQIGVDVEFMEKKLEFADIARKFFTANETKNILACEKKERQKQAFFNCWTRKEAFLKAIGKGLSFALDRVEVAVDDVGDVAENRAVSIEVKDAQYGNKKWSLYALDPAASYAAALVIEGGVDVLRCYACV